MTEIKKVNSLEELRKYEIVESTLKGAKLSNNLVLESTGKEWYSFIKQVEKNEDILIAQVNRNYSLKENGGVIELTDDRVIFDIQTPTCKGYNYRKSLLVNNGLWRKTK